MNEPGRARIVAQRAFSLARSAFGPADGKTITAGELVAEAIERDPGLGADVQWDSRLAINTWLLGRDLAAESVTRKEVIDRWLPHHREIVELLSARPDREPLAIGMVLRAWGLAEAVRLPADHPLQRTFLKPAIKGLGLEEALIKLERPAGDLLDPDGGPVETWRLRDYLDKLSRQPDWQASFPMVAIDVIPPTDARLKEEVDAIIGDLCEGVEWAPATGGEPLASAATRP
jgi:hypothetical protein